MLRPTGAVPAAFLPVGKYGGKREGEGFQVADGKLNEQ